MDLVKLMHESDMLLNTSVNFSEQNMNSISSDRRHAWGSMLSSLATSEKIENLILDPLIEKYTVEDEPVGRYLQAHSRDELKHYNWLTQYVKENTQYVRTGKSLSDRIFYDFLLPRLALYAQTQAIYLFAIMYFYELFTLDLYKELIRAANEDQLPNAQNIFLNIRTDEVRHCQAAKDLIRFTLQKSPASIFDRIIIRLWLRLFQLDMSTFFWCIHNKRVRQSTRGLGISPRRMWQMSGRALHNTMTFIHQEAP